MRVALRLLALAALAAGAAANKNHTAKVPKAGLSTLPAHALKYTYRTHAAPYAPAGVGAGLAEPSIALSKDGKTLIFGEPTASINSITDTGFVSIAAYDAKRKTITETQRLTGTNPGGFFGASTALDPTGKVLVVGEPRATVAGAVQAGQVHIYTKLGLSKQWVLSGTVTAGSFSQAQLGFGFSVATSKGGQILVVGVGASGSVTNGEVHIFRLSNALKPQGAQQAKQYTYTLVTRLVSPVANDQEFGRVVSTTAGGKAVAVSSPNAFLNNPAGRVWVYGFSKAQNAYVQTAAFTGPSNTNFGIQVKLAPNGKSLAICDAFANSQQGAISIATYSVHQKTFALTQTNYLPTVNGYTFSFFCTGLAYSPDSKYIAVAEAAAGQKGALWIMQSLRKPAWNITAGPIAGPTATGSFLGRKGVALSGGAKVLAANSENPKSAWVFDRVRA